MLQLTDKKSRSTRRALLRFLSHYDYGYRDAAIEISGIVGRDPSDYEVTAPVLLVWLLENDFKPVMRYDRRAQRIIDQIAAEYVGYRSGTIGRSPLGCDMSLLRQRRRFGFRSFYQPPIIPGSSPLPARPPYSTSRI